MEEPTTERNRSDLVSIIIPTYYRNEHLRNAIRSVLNQDYAPIEIIVVDDSGERFAEPIVADYDVKYISHDTNRGGNPARNTGIKEATGRYIQLLDDDDELLEEKLRSQIAMLRANDTIGVVYCGVIHESLGEIHPEPEIRGDVLRQALTFSLFPCSTSTMLIQRDAIEEVFPLRVRPSGDDLGMMIELALITEFDYVDEPLVRKGALETSRGQGLTNANERLNIIKEYNQLYDQFPPSVKKMALSKVYHQIGSATLSKSIWSSRAVVAYWKALYFHPDPDLRFVAECLISIFGSPGKNVAKRIRAELID